MKFFYSLTIALFILNLANALARELDSKELNTDSIHKILTVFQCDSLIKANTATPGFYILDVRTTSEFCSGHLLNANNIDYRASCFWDMLAVLDRNIIYLVHCKGGSRSLPTYNKMISLHFREVYMMNGGFDQWKLDGLPYVTGIISNTERIMTLKKTLTVYPNPANSEIMVEINIPINKTTLSIVNLSGKELIKQQIYNNKFRIDVSRLPVGVYFVKLMNTNGFEVCKFVK